nr:MAG TPA: portal protein [Caudoviricetes sp.]
MSWVKSLFGYEVREEQVLNENSYIDTADDIDLNLPSYDATTRVTRQQALSVPAVASALFLISGIIAGIPVRMYKREGNTIAEILDDERIKLLNIETNSILGAYETKQAMINDLIMEGACYCYIGKNGNSAESLQYLPKHRVSLLDNGKLIDRQIYYLVDGNYYDNFNIMSAVRNCSDGVHGRGLLDDNAMHISSMYNALVYENGVISKGVRKGFLKSEGRLTVKALEALKKAWRYMTSKLGTSDVIVLNKGITFESADSTAVENQLNESKQTNADLIYKIFGFTDKTFIDEKAFNIFVKTTIMPIVNCFIEAINRSLLLETEKGSYYFSLDMNDLLKADMLTRFNAYKTALESNWINVDEIRKREDLSPMGIDFVSMNLANVFYYPKTKKVYTPNTGAFGDLTTLKAEKGGENSES